MAGTQQNLKSKNSARGEREREREMREWQGLGVVDTIYEDDQEEEGDGESFGSMSLSPAGGAATPTPPSSSSPPPLTPPSPSLESRIEAWSQARGRKPDTVIRVRDRCFHLHKEPLVSRSVYLKRRLTESSDVSVSPPSNITAETFAQVASFCYGSKILVTPFNLAALRVAAEWLEMPEDDNNDDGLLRLTESYFFQEVATDADNAAAVLRSCMALLAGAADVEADAAAALAVKCVEVLAGSDGGWLDDVSELPADEFRLLAESMRAGFVHDHDLLYRVVDYYLENHEGKLTEEEKTRICYTINCTKLSHHILLHLVQNARLPLRFVVQAMLVEQLHNRSSIFDRPAADAVTSLKLQTNAAGGRPGNENLTLGAILQRDAALRQSAHIRATMEATSLRIQSLERDLASLRQRLRWSEEKQEQMDSVRSASFRIVRHESGAAEGEQRPAAVTGQKWRSCNGSATATSGRGLRWKLVHGFKSIFRRTGVVESNHGSSNGSGDHEKVETCSERAQSGHRRNRSFA